jgi:DNA polymerase-1
MEDAMRFRLDVPPPETLDTEELVAALLDDLYNHTDVVAYDTETSGLEWKAEVYTIQLAYHSAKYGDRRVFIPVYKAEHRLTFLPMLKPWFENPRYLKIAQNAQFDRRIMANHNIEVHGLYADTLKLHHTYNEEGEHGLKSMAYKLKGLHLIDFKDIFGKSPSAAATIDVFETNSPELRMRALEYATLDAWATLEVYEWLRKQMKEERWNCPDSLQAIGVPKNPSWWDQHLCFDVPFIEVLQKMEWRGVPFNKQVLLELEKPMIADAAKLAKEINDEYGTNVNFNSPTQVSEFLFGQLKLAPLKKTTKGWSVDEETMNELLGQGHDIARRILAFRKLEKNRGTFVSGMIKHIQRDGRIHSSLQATTVTNRIRGREPNLLNLPNVEKDEYHIRKAIEAPPGYVIVCVDESNLEMRLAACMYGDEGMVQAIAEGKDIHAMTAALMYGLNYDDVIKAKKSKEKTAQQHDLVLKRGAAKVTGFGINYGITAAGLSVQLSEVLKRVVTVEEAKDLIALYLETRPGIARGIKFYHNQLYSEGCVYTRLGRRRTPSRAFHASRSDREAAKRQATNFPIQGTAADLLQLAMLEVEEDKELKHLGAEMILQIHDELLVLTPEENAEPTYKRVKAIMENPKGWPGLPYGMQLVADGGWAKNWFEAK